MITIVNLHKSFGAHHVLKGINMRINAGKTRVILGPSGSGKSVLMKHIIGLLCPDSGQVLFDGADITCFDKTALLTLRRRFGMVFQQSALFDSMTVFDNVAFPLREHTHLSPQSIQQRVLQKLALVGLQNVGHKYSAELSGGMRKRVAVARAVVLDPSILLYDEPTTGLDPLTTESVDQLIIDTQRQLKVTSVVISHDVSSALRIAHDIAVINDGEIVEDCPASCILQSGHPFVQKFMNSWFQKRANDNLAGFDA